MTMVSPFQTQMDIIPDDSTQEQQIEQLGVPAPPERRVDNNFKAGLVIRPNTVVVGGLYTESVSTGGQVGIGGTVLIAHIVPILVKSLEHVGILYFSGEQ